MESSAVRRYVRGGIHVSRPKGRNLGIVWIFRVGRHHPDGWAPIFDWERHDWRGEVTFARIRKTFLLL